MGVKFRGMGPNRSAVLQRERILFFGGSTLMLSLIFIGTLLVYNNTVVEAGKDIIVEPNVDSEIAFGTVVLVAPTIRVPKGTKLDASYLKEVHWPRDQVPEGAVRSMADLEGMFAAAVLPANQPVLRGSIGVTPPSLGISELLPAGHRAVTIEVNAVSGIEGWATPGAHVDIFLTYLDPQEQVYKTRVAVENAVVLSYGGKAKKADEQEMDQADVKSTVTLAVAFDDSLKVQTAAAVGKITLALRNSGDMNGQGNTEFSVKDWSEPKRAPKQDNKFVAKGFASVTDQTGKPREFILGQDNKWWQNSGDEG
jgi:Flp pilus assembly protein CpaB